MHKNHILQVLQNDRKYLLSKRKLMKKPNPLPQPFHLNPTPVFAARKHSQPSMLPRSIATTNMKFPSSKFSAAQHDRSSVYGRTKTDQSRCSSARSRSSNLSTRYNEMRRIQNDNIRMVEKILLVKPTLEKKKHNEFYKQHREMSKRLSRYGQNTMKRAATNTNRNHFVKHNSAILPDLKPKRLSIQNSFNNYKPNSLSKVSY